MVQTDTYHQAREERKITTPSEHRDRVRSSSFDDTNVSSSVPIPLSNTLRESKLSTGSLSISAPTTPTHNRYESSLSKKESSDSEGHSKSFSSDSSCLSPPPSMGLSDEEEEVDGHDDTGSHTTDSGHHSAIEFRPSPSLRTNFTRTSLCVPRDSDVRRSQIELSHIYVSLQRQSQSYETLLNTYTEESPHLRGFLDSTLNELTKLSKTSSLQSLDSVFSDDDEKEHDDLTCSLNIPISSVSIDSDHTSDYGSDAVHIESPVSKIQEKHKARRILFRHRSEVADNCPLSPDMEQCLLEQREGEPPSPSHTSFLLRSRLQRSKSCTNPGSKSKRKRLKKKAPSKLPKEEEPKTPSELLNSFQVASLGYSLGAKENIDLRNAIFDVEPNSESVSYRLSVERESHELTH